LASAGRLKRERRCGVGVFSTPPITAGNLAMPSPQSRTASIISDLPIVEEIKTTLYVDSARLKVLSQETKIHPADDVQPSGVVTALPEESP
jgi:hypothetical protein